jgi:hypothetical protein
MSADFFVFAAPLQKTPEGDVFAFQNRKAVSSSEIHRAFYGNKFCYYAEDLGDASQWIVLRKVQKYKSTNLGL